MNKPLLYSEVAEVVTLAALYRLKRRFGLERARLNRWEQEARREGRTPHADRCYYEATQWGVAMGMIDDEIKKAKGER